MAVSAFRAEIVYMQDAPSLDRDAGNYVHIPDGLMLVEDGVIAGLGAYGDMLGNLSDDMPVTHFPGALIVPGFVDSHVHYPQVEVIASHGVQLMDWLERYTFPAEMKFSDPVHARAEADFFLDELLRNGTTSALVFGTVHKASADALFEAALDRNMRLIGGKVLMDRNAPPALCDTVESGRADTLALIQAWRGRGRLGYAVTPRFAPTCSDDQLTMAGRILQDHEDVYLHTHLSENHGEIEKTAQLFPQAKDYVDVYDRFGLVTGRSVFAHCIHLDDSAFERLAKAGAAVACCPTSNLFLGSGLFDLKAAFDHGVTVGLGTDIGGGTSFSMLQTMNEAYKVAQLRGGRFHPLTPFYLATLGGARALNLADRIGTLAVGTEADFLVLDQQATPLLARRLAAARDIVERLFVFSILGDDRAVRHTYVAGEEWSQSTVLGTPPRKRTIQ